MKLGIVVNSITTELSDYTTTNLAMQATNLGHEVWYIPVGDFAYDPDENVHARARSVQKSQFRSTNSYLSDLQSKQARMERITIEELDVLFLRNDPAEDFIERPWARLAGLNFGRLAMRHGVVVVNDPNGLSQAVNKMYLQYFSESVRPRTLITRDSQEIKDFIKDQGGSAVIKPLSGSGGHNVFLIQPEEKANLNQIIDAVIMEGYALTQEYLPEAKHGDTRLFLLNGKPLISKGRYAAMKRVRPDNDGDMRSNITAGAVARPVKIDDCILELAETVRPKLLQDGMFFVGLDIVGSKLMEINVFSPGGLHSASKLEERNFSREIILALEHKVDYKQQYRDTLSNIDMAIL